MPLKVNKTMADPKDIESSEQAAEEAVQDFLAKLKNGRLPIHQFAQEDAPPRDIVFSGLARGQAGALYAPGATGKSYFTLQVCLSIAVGRDIAGVGDVKRGKVVYFSSEDNADDVWRRVRKVAQKYTFSAAELALMQANLHVVDMTEQEQVNVLNDVQYKALELFVREVGFDVRLVVFDTLSQFHIADENQNYAMKPVVRRFKLLALHLNAAVLYLHHCSKGTVMSGDSKTQQSARGASCIIDDVRWAGYVARMSLVEIDSWVRASRPNIALTEEDSNRFMVFGDSKTNYSESGSFIWFERCEGGVLAEVNLKRVDEPVKAGKGKASTPRYVLDEIEEMKGKAVARCGEGQL